nr:RecB family exonuclease [Tomitella cavernea]
MPAMDTPAPGDPVQKTAPSQQAHRGGRARGRRHIALSPSRASDFKQCPLLYRFRAVDRIPETPSTAQARGTLVHTALERLYALPAAERVQERAAGLLEPAWSEMVAGQPELAGLVGPADRAQFLDEARGLIAGYYTMEDPTRFEPDACEQRVETRLDDGTPLRGFIDRIDVAPTGQVRVVDYKTGRLPWGPGKATALFQMKFYALALLRERGVLPTQLRLMYLKSGEDLIYEPTEPELDRFERTVSALWQAIRTVGSTGDFRPTPSKLCDWCDHKALCPAFDGTPPPYPGWPGE